LTNTNTPLHPSGDPAKTEREGPLSGITILDLTRVLAGPYCTMILSDLGARIIKVEPPGGDDSRGYGPWLDDQSAYFMSLNRGKESIVLNLKSHKDKKVFDKLLASSDVLIENYRPKTMDKLGYGWTTLHKKYPTLIYAACSGFGQTGPDSRRPAYDMVVQGIGGLMSLTGHPGGPPTRVGTAIGDITAGLFTAIGINAALYDRSITGKGKLVDVSMLDCQLAILENAIARFYATGENPGPSAARHPSIAPFECYQSLDGHIIIAAGNDSLFTHLCEAIAAPEISNNPKFTSNRLRMENVVALKEELEAVLTKETTSFWLQKLGDSGVPSGPLNTVKEAVQNPQILARNMIVDVLKPGSSEALLKIAGNPIKLSDYEDPQVRGPAPGLNEHYDKITNEH
jgi:CoA:oxalate CoA-transferase